MIDNRTSKLFRGLAILMVIGSHYAGWMYADPFSETWRVWVSSWGVYGVDIFFLLSGYGLVKAYEKSGIDKRFVIRRFLNRYVPYILIVGFFSFVLDRSVDSPEAVWKLFTGFDFWFMCIIFVFYIMFMVFYRIGHFKELLLTAGVIGFSYWLYTREFADFWFLSNGAFLIGVYAATLEKKFAGRVKELIVKCNLTAIAFALMVACAFWHVFGGELTSHLCASVMFTIMALGLCVQFEGGGIILPTIGRFSLYVYLIHSRLFWIVAGKFSEMDYTKMAALAGVITLVVSVIIGFVFEFCLGKIGKLVK